MKYTVFLAAISAAVASAQVVYNETTGTFTCPAYNPNGAYCAGNSNIIIRCNNGVGQPGNCNDNLAGSPPQGVNYAPCYETSPSAGDAACSKNCIVYAPGGNFPVPGCTPTYSSSSTTSSTTASVYGSSTTSTSTSTLVYSSSTSSTTTAVYSSNSSSSSSSSSSASTPPTTTPTIPIYPTNPSYNTTTDYTTLTVTSTCTTEGSTVTTTYTTVYCPKCHDTTLSPYYPTKTYTYTYPTGTGTGIPQPPSNGTTVITNPTGPATATPVGPTTTVPPQFTGAASMNSAGALIAGVGILAAYFL